MTIVLFLVHFGFTLLYVLPERLVGNTLRTWSTSYMYPVFHQGWSLFAPDVANWQSELYYRYYLNGEWSDWTSTSEIEGVTSHPKMREMAEKLNHYLTIQLQEGLYYDGDTPKFDQVIVQGHYKSAVYFVQQHAARMGVNAMDSLQLKMEVGYSPKPNEADRRDTKVIEYPKLLVPKR